jgi:pilus assembly protein CpaE
MISLPVVLVGIDEGLVGVLRHELSSAGVEVECEFNSALMAIDCLRHYKKQPKVLLVEIGAQCEANTIRQLTTDLSGWPIMALLPSQKTEDFLRVNRAGALQILPLPIDPVDLHQALRVIAAQAERDSLDRHVFAVTGAAGGSGATTVAVNLAYEIAEKLGRETILAELTLQMGSLASMLDAHPRFTLPQLIREIHRVDDYLVEKALVSVTERLRILAGSQELNSIPAVIPDHLLKIVGCLKTLTEVTVVDMPGTFDELKFEVLKACDQVIVVANQTIPSIKSLRLVCESLSEERVVHSLWVVLNRYDPAMKGFTCDDIKDMLGVARVLTITNDFHAANLAVNKGRPLRLVAPRTRMLADLDRLMYELLGCDGQSLERNGQGFFGRVLSAIKRPEKTRQECKPACGPETMRIHFQ